MAEFINTIEKLGDDVVLVQFINKSITEFKDDVLTTLHEYIMYCCTNLTNVILPNVTTVYGSVFYGCSNLELVDLPKAKTFYSNVFANCSNLKTLILRSETVGAFGTNMLTSTPITSGTGYIYVPSALVDTYKSTYGWKTYANQFRALESYTLEGTIDGTFYDSDTTKHLYCASLTSVPDNKFRDNKVLESVDFPNVTSIGEWSFAECSKLTTLILRSSTLCTLTSSSAFFGSPIRSGSGYIYVNDNLVDTYKSDTNWSLYASQIKPISELE